MINLNDYADYWRNMISRIDALKSAIPVTLDEQMGRKLQGLSADDVPALFFMPPQADGYGSSPDDYGETNFCVIFVMQKYDPQRTGSIDVLAETQPIVEEIKRLIVEDSCRGCFFMRPDVASINTIPETEFYRTLAGWSVGFKAE